MPSSLPALARAEKYVSRLHRTGRDDLVDAAVAAGDVGAQLLDLVRRARAEGVDAEAALRETLRQLEQRSAATERRRPPTCLSPDGARATCGAEPPLGLAEAEEGEPGATRQGGCRERRARGRMHGMRYSCPAVHGVHLSVCSV